MTCADPDRSPDKQPLDNLRTNDTRAITHSDRIPPITTTIIIIIIIITFTLGGTDPVGS